LTPSSAIGVRFAVSSPTTVPASAASTSTSSVTATTALTAGSRDENPSKEVLDVDDDRSPSNTWAPGAPVGPVTTWSSGATATRVVVIEEAFDRITAVHPAGTFRAGDPWGSGIAVRAGDHDVECHVSSP
jgi:hypothetical protein